MEEKIISYYLGELSEEEEITLEEEYFSDESKYRELQVAQDELIDAYTRGQLPANRRTRFEKHFLATPWRQQRINFSHTLNDYLSGKPAPQPVASIREKTGAVKQVWWQAIIDFLRTINPVLGYSMMAAMLLMVIGSFWMITDISQLKAQLEKSKANGQSTLEETNSAMKEELARERTRAEQLAKQLEQEKERSAQLEKQLIGQQLAGIEPAILSFVLTPSLSGNGRSLKKLVIPTAAQVVYLQLGITDLNAVNDYEKLRAQLSNSDGEKIWQGDQLKAPSKSNPKILLKIKSDLLSSDDYQIKLSGAADNGRYEEIEVYPFKVVRED